jgi:lysozyme family protein
VKANFDQALRLVLQHEGGFVNDPRDPGGMTNLGVTKAVWERWTDKVATEEEMRSLTPEKVAPLYKTQYWDVIHGDELPDGVDYCVFDAAVNMGTGTAAKLLQQVANVQIDGKIGPHTLTAVHQMDDRLLIEAFCDARERRYKMLDGFKTFGNGWLRRLAGVEVEAAKMSA